MVWSSGTAPVAASWSRRYCRRLRAAPSASACSVTSSFVASSAGRERMRRASAPIARPNSSGRPTFSPCQKGMRPGTPGAGETSTRSCVISSTRQLDAPRRNTSPSFVSKTISSSSSPTRPLPFSAPARNTPYRPRSGIVPPLEIATTFAPSRDRTTPAVRSHTMRGRSSANSSDGYRPESMSSTPSNALRGSSANGAARRMTRSRSSTPQSSIAVIATTCCATMSSGLRGYRSGSTLPANMPSVIAALARRSPRYFGMITPVEGSSMRWPARRPLPRGPRPGRFFGGPAETGHVLSRNFAAELERLFSSRVEAPSRTRHAVIETAEETRDLVKRTLCRREADALQPRRIPAAQLLEPLEGQREVRAALRRDDGVDLVDDDALHRAERLAREARQDQVQRLRRRDENVRGLALVTGSLARRCVAGPDRGGGLAMRNAQALGLTDDPHKRLAPGALDVDGGGFERA